MSQSSVTTIRCDAPNCKALVIGGTPANAMELAEKAGWKVAKEHHHRDFCPEHKA